MKILSYEREMILSDSFRGKYSVSTIGWKDKMDIKLQFFKNIYTQIHGDIMSVEKQNIQEYFIYLLVYSIILLALLIVFFKLIYLYKMKKNNRIVSPDTLKDIALVFNNSQQKEIKRLMKNGNVEHIYKFLIQAIKDANQTKDLFLASMSHEVRTPLNGILGFTQLLKESNEKEEQLEYISIIEKSSDNLLTIVNDILDLSKIKAEKIELECIEFDPIMSFEVAVESYAAKASEENIDFNIYLDPALPTILKGDPTKISQVIINLVSNAIKFTSKNGEVNVDITKLNENDNSVEIKFSVSDTGIGITENQKRTFLMLLRRQMLVQVENMEVLVLACQFQENLSILWVEN
jgi:two-component system sensor histidine kinase BarA